ncbi:MAG: helicase-related protein [Vicinamibacterales bacterium]|nr:helicase-related protein [Vicinamibacterales bacterium]
MQETRSGWRQGDRVSVRGEEWVLDALVPYERCARLTLRGCGPANGGDSCEVVAPFDQPVVRRGRGRWRRAGRAAALEAAARAVVEAPPAGGLITARAAALDLWPWQLAPALAVVAGHPRLLIADEVGLGKTIQAGLIAAELRARGEAARICIVTPAGLRAQWVQELGDRFGLEAALVDQARLARDRAALPRGINPWRLPPIVVTSIDLVRQQEVLAALDHVPIDLLIVDEAHHAATGTDRGHAVAHLAGHALRVVLLTATPHTGDDAAFRALAMIGAIERRAPMLVFRRTQAGVGLRLPRRERVLRVRPTGAEAALFDALRGYLHWIARECQGAAHGALLASVLARRAASSPAALARTIARRRRLLVEGLPAGEQLRLPWDEPDAGDDVVPDHVVGAHVSDDAAGERAALDTLQLLAERASSHASKVRALARWLGRIDEPVLIFTEYRDTLEEIARALDGSARLSLLHGGLTRQEREAAVRGFVGGSVTWLLSTDAGSEGLNLQARCRVAVNLEAPPSPTRLAQRAGRLARLGQARRVHVLTLAHTGGFDEPALANLDRRQAAIDHALDPHTAPDRVIVDGFHAAATREAARVASMRRLARITDRPRDVPRRPRIPCALAATRTSGRRWMLVVRADTRDAGGRLLESAVLAALVSWTGASPRDWPSVRAALTHAVSAVEGSRVFALRAAAIDAEHARGRAALLARAEALAARSLAPQGLVQTSLFDARAAQATEDAGRLRGEAAAWWHAHVERITRARGPAHAGTPVLAAAFTVPDGGSRLAWQDT